MKIILIKSWKSRILSCLLYSALAITMLPLGILTAFASNTTDFIDGTSPSDVRNTGTVQSQPESVISIVDVANIKANWDIADVSANYNGGSISLDNIVYDVASWAQNGSSYSSEVKISGSRIVKTVTVASTKNGFVVDVANENTEVNIGQNDQPVSEFEFYETTASTFNVGDTFSIACPDGVAFNRLPDIVVFAPSIISLDSSLSPDHKIATWTIKTEDTENSDVLRFILSSIDVAPTVAPDTPIEFNFTTSNPDLMILPSPVKVALAVVEKVPVTTFQTDIEPNSKGWITTTPKITLSTTDTDATTYFRWDNNSNWSVYTGTQDGPEGIHTIQYYSEDTFGNKEEIKTKELKVDSQQPGYSLDETHWPEEVEYGVIEVGLYTWDISSGIEAAYLYVDGTKVATDSVAPYLFDLDTRNFSYGPHTIKMEICDVAGNMNSKSSTVEFVNSTDVWTNILENEYSWFSEKPQITFTTDFEGVKIYYAWDSTNVWQEYSGQPFLANNGISTLYFYSKKPGFTEDIWTSEFWVDDMEPVITDTNLPQQNSTISGSIAVDIDATDSISGVFGAYLLVDGEYVGEDTESPYSIALNTKDFADGTHIVELEVYDWTGNYDTRSSNIAFKNTSSGYSSSGGGGGVDASGGGGSPASTTTLSAPQNLTATPGNAAINLTWSENKESGFNEFRIYRVDGAINTDKSSSLKPIAIAKSPKYDDTTIKAGTYTYYVTAADSKGNEGKASRVTVTYPAVKSQITFSDISASAWYKDYVSTLISNNIAGGYPDGTFKPDGQVSRAEFAKIICNAMGWTLEDPSNPSFSDVSKSHWAYKYIETLKKHGVSSGYPDGSFGPDKKITRAEISAMIAKTLGLTGENPTGMNDIDGSWAKTHIGACIKAGVVSGYPNSSFKPDNNATRAEAAKMIVGLMGKKK